MLIKHTIEPLYMQGPNPLGPTLKLFQSSKIEKAKAKFVTTIICPLGESHMFRSKVFEPTLPGFSYRIFIEGLRSVVTLQWNQLC
jgi:hypothetical protein